jgi:excisionase family DNA binding protein
MKDNKTWIPLAEAARRLETSGPVVRRLIDRGQLSVRRLPGCHPRVAATELAQLIAQNTRPAQQAS